LNDIQHQECQNPCFEQEPPQILQLTATIIYICSYLKRNEADLQQAKCATEPNIYPVSTITTETKKLQALERFLRKGFHSYNPLQLLPSLTRCDSNILG